MNTMDILNIVNKDVDLKAHFISIFPSDKLPYKVNKLPCALIINTDESVGVGMHWVAVYIDERRIGYYFDSYGLPPFINKIELFMQRNCDRILINSRKFQSAKSSVCGIYCIYFLYWFSRFFSFFFFFYIFGQHSKSYDRFL